MFFMRSMDLFHHYNGIINDQPNGGSNGTKRHNIQGLPCGIQHYRVRHKVTGIVRRITLLALNERKKITATLLPKQALLILRQ